MKKKKKGCEAEDKVFSFENDDNKRLSFKEELGRHYDFEKKDKFKVSKSMVDLTELNQAKLEQESQFEILLRKSKPRSSLYQVE